MALSDAHASTRITTDGMIRALQNTVRSLIWGQKNGGQAIAWLAWPAWPSAPPLWGENGTDVLNAHDNIEFHNSVID